MIVALSARKSTEHSIEAALELALARMGTAAEAGR
jgi:hypothetical protein